MIYLDNNATSMMDPEVAGLMYRLECEGVANPASQHSPGRKALRILEDAKTAILRNLGATVDRMHANQLILTSGGTEANNLILRSLCAQRDSLVIIGGMEHPSLTTAAESPDLCRAHVKLLPGQESGSYDLNRLSEWLEAVYAGHQPYRKVALVSLMLANNETGVLNDLKQVVSICQKYQVPVHSDIVQAVGKVDFDILECGVSAVTIAAHKIHGPVGIGALITGSNPLIQPMLVGGGQQLGWRAGTESVVLAAGMAKAFELAAEARKQGRYRQVARLRDALEQQITEQLNSVTVNGYGANRVPQTTNLAFEGMDRQALQMSLDLSGVACSTGSACSSGSARPSPTLQAMGLSEQKIAGSLRFSLSRFTTQQEIDQATDTIVNAVRKKRR